MCVGRVGAGAEGGTLGDGHVVCGVSPVCGLGWKQQGQNGDLALGCWGCRSVTPRLG